MRVAALGDIYTVLADMSKALQALQTLPWERKNRLDAVLSKLRKMLDAVQGGVEDLNDDLWPTLSKFGDAAIEVGDALPKLF